MMTRHQDVLPNSDFLVHLYYIIHKGFSSDDQVQTAGGTSVKYPVVLLFSTRWRTSQTHSTPVHRPFMKTGKRIFVVANLLFIFYDVLCCVIMTQATTWFINKYPYPIRGVLGLNSGSCSCAAVLDYWSSVLKAVCQSVVMKNSSLFWHLPPPLATPFLIFKSGLAPFLSDGAEWRWMEYPKTKDMDKSVCVCVCVRVCACVCVPPDWVSIAPWQCDKLVRMFSMSLNNVWSPCRVYVIN